MHTQHSASFLPLMSTRCCELEKKNKMLSSENTKSLHGAKEPTPCLNWCWRSEADGPRRAVTLCLHSPQPKFVLNRSQCGDITGG